ncbi:MAG: hypothetical protein U0798_15005 [Gemmataceae bacterium]
MIIFKNIHNQLEVFTLGSQGQLIHTWENPDHSWSGPENLGGVNRNIAGARNADGKLEIIGWDGQELKHIREVQAAGSWGQWASLGNLNSPISVVVNSEGKLGLLSLMNNNSIRIRWQITAGGNFGSWEYPNAIVGSNLTLPVGASSGAGGVGILTVGYEGNVWYIRQVSPGGDWDWSTHKNLGGHITGLVGVVKNHAGLLEVFGISYDKQISHIWETSPGVWSAWENLGGNSIVQFAVGKNSDGRLELFAVTENKTLIHRWENTAGGAWNSQWVALCNNVSKMLGIYCGKRIGILITTGGSDQLCQLTQIAQGNPIPDNIGWTGVIPSGSAANPQLVGFGLTDFTDIVTEVAVDVASHLAGYPSIGVAYGLLHADDLGNDDCPGNGLESTGDAGGGGEDEEEGGEDDGGSEGGGSEGDGNHNLHKHTLRKRR